jgi:hypothetical protein
MENEILYKEKQNFAHPMVMIIVLPFIIFFVYAIVQQVILGHTVADNLFSNTQIILYSCLLLAGILFFGYCNFLETIIKTDGIYVRYLPYFSNFEFYSWQKISKCYVRAYNPMTEYGGWGLRSGKNGAAYNISGDKGLQLEFKSKRNLLIGTSKSEEMQEVLKSFFPEFNS